MTQTGTVTPVQSGTVNNGNEGGVLYTHQN